MNAKMDCFLPAIRKFADYILRCCQEFGDERKISLIGDAIDPASRQWARYDSAEVEADVALSNPAYQQHLIRLFVGLTNLTEERQYEQFVSRTLRFIFDTLTDSQGLIYWGGHVAYDLYAEKVVYAKAKLMVHELKFNYPCYELMWEIDPDATRRFIEAFWSTHILDWSNLDFNRHGIYDKPRGAQWDNGYNPGEVFFWGRGLTFVNTGSDLYYAAAMLSKLSGDEKPLIWAKRLARRYVDTRQAGVEISGYQFSQSAFSECNGPSIRGDRAQYQYAPYIPSGHLVYEGTLFRPRPVVQRCQLFLGEMLGQSGTEFSQWAIEEMTAWGRTAYRRSDNSFIPMLIDGYSLEGFVIRKEGYFGPKGRIEKPIPADADFLWMYASGYRAARTPFLWEMTRQIAEGNGLGDIGDPDGRGINLNVETGCANYKNIYGMLELYRASNCLKYLELAIQIGANLVRERFDQGRIEPGSGIILVDDPAMLALLSLTAIMHDKDHIVPKSFV
jgi:pectate lyase